ncbi:MAG TPA: hypothetical protein PL187_00160 [Caldilinea sp.]|nr:hypothetical protein [Caldilinea sp.]
MNNTSVSPQEQTVNRWSETKIAAFQQEIDEAGRSGHKVKVALPDDDGFLTYALTFAVSPVGYAAEVKVSRSGEFVEAMAVRNETLEKLLHGIAVLFGSQRLIDALLS